jgi:P22 coat protein - gene protein 5
LPAAGAYITLGSGSAATTYTQNLAFHQDSFTLGIIDMLKPSSTQCWVERYENLSLRYLIQYMVGSDEEVGRLDCLYGWATLRPEFAVRF